MQLQKSIEAFKALDVEILSIHREEKEGVAGLKKTAKKTMATYHLSSDLGNTSTGAWSKGGFHSYLVLKDGTLAAELTGTKNDRPTASEILEKAKEVLPAAKATE